MMEELGIERVHDAKTNADRGINRTGHNDNGCMESTVR